MGADWAGVAVGIALYLGLRLIDYLLPKGRHLKIVDRYSHPDDTEDDDETT